MADFGTNQMDIERRLGLNPQQEFTRRLGSISHDGTDFCQNSSDWVNQEMHGLNLTRRSQSNRRDSWTTSQLIRGHLRLPPIQNIGGRTNVTQVEQTWPEYEQKTERSFLPSLISTETQHVKDQDILKEKDLTNFGHRLNLSCIDQDTQE